jgi:3-dehydroquinate synthase
MKDIVISTPSCQSVIHCGEGAFNEYVKKISAKKIFVVTDSNVAKIYDNLIKEYFSNATLCVIPAGEKSKNYSQLLFILKSMIQNGLTRSSLVIALGGGVVGDITGLAASLYMRGVKLIQIPTTLLSQVDSSVGGKTAVDFMNVKNVIGSFYQPSEVIVDPLFLNTLPLREMRCGMGEIVKYAALDGDIYNLLFNNKQKLFSHDKIDNSKLPFGVTLMDEIVYSCISHKAKVVSGDEHDLNGLRKTLNLGHTTGHAFELYYKRKSHGEFVLIGMYYELYIAQKKGVCEKIYADTLRDLIKRVIKNIPAYDDIEEAAAYAKYDKKNDENSTISIVVPKSYGVSEEIKLPIAEYISLIKECRDDLRG